MRVRDLIVIPWAAGLFLAACGGSSTKNPDAMVETVDANTPPSIDAMTPPTPDAAVVMIDAMTPPTPDAMIPLTPDASGPAIDGGGATDIPAICTGICEHLFVCIGTPPDPSCQTGCEADLVDCTPDQLMAVDACSTVTCTPGDPQPVVDCLTAITCVMG